MEYRKSSTFIIRCFFFCITTLTSNLLFAQEPVGSAVKQPMESAASTFLSGINYTSPDKWMFLFDDWNPVQGEKDLKAMKRLGIKVVRFFPIWPSLQPSPHQINERMLKNIDKFLRIGYKHGLKFQFTIFTGWMSGGTFLPSWAKGNIFKDAELIDAEQYLVATLAKRYRGNKAIHSFDIGNELNVLPYQMKLKVKPGDVSEWMRTIYTTFKKSNPDGLLTIGIGTGFDPLFHIDAIASSCDLMSVHSYAYFHGTLLYDPIIGQRTLYSSNFLTEWAAMTGKHVLMQENGANTQAMLPLEVAKFLRVNYISNWAEGAVGYFWWDSHNVKDSLVIDRDGLVKEFSLNKMRVGELGADRFMGVLSVDNKENVQGAAYKKCTQLIEKLGAGWHDILPTCYVLVPNTTAFYNTMRTMITPFTLAKQAHFDVKLCRENQPIPDDASCVVISGFKLSEEGKENIKKYLTNGGKVYQSYYNDFSDNINFSQSEDTLGENMLYLTNVEGGLSGRTALNFNGVPVRHVIHNEKLQDIAPVKNMFSDYFDTAPTAPVFLKTSVGKGVYYFLAGNIEYKVGHMYNPWAHSDAYKFYLALMPETSIRVDNNLVEFYDKKRGMEEILILINHENSRQDVTLSSNECLKLKSISTRKKQQKQGTELHYELGPAEVLILRVKRQ